LDLEIDDGISIAVLFNLGDTDRRGHRCGGRHPHLTAATCADQYESHCSRDQSFFDAIHGTPLLALKMGKDAGCLLLAGDKSRFFRCLGENRGALFGYRHSSPLYTGFPALLVRLQCPTLLLSSRKATRVRSRAWIE
jgi:hypothetical protein